MKCGDCVLSTGTLGPDVWCQLVKGKPRLRTKGEMCNRDKERKAVLKEQIEG
jgi:hypothetical protein